MYLLFFLICLNTICSAIAARFVSVIAVHVQHKLNSPRYAFRDYAIQDLRLAGNELVSLSPRALAENPECDILSNILLPSAYYSVQLGLACGYIGP